MLGWHGALSLDAILTPAGPSYIDVNPRLVEPANAWRSGVDLVQVVLRIACDGTAAQLEPGRPGVRSHQLLIAALGAAQRTGKRRLILRELLAAVTHRGIYTNSVEELTPISGDPLSAIPLIAAAAATLATPAAWRWFSSSAVEAYALTPMAWRTIVASACGQAVAAATEGHCP
jgi:hypothetical protein